MNPTRIRGACLPSFPASLLRRAQTIHPFVSFGHSRIEAAASEAPPPLAAPAPASLATVSPVPAFLPAPPLSGYKKHSIIFRSRSARPDARSNSKTRSRMPSSQNRSKYQIDVHLLLECPYSWVPLRMGAQRLVVVAAAVRSIFTFQTTFSRSTMTDSNDAPCSTATDGRREERPQEARPRNVTSANHPTDG